MTPTILSNADLIQEVIKNPHSTELEKELAERLSIGVPRHTYTPDWTFDAGLPPQQLELPL